jgi:hypothetical protein
MPLTKASQNVISTNICTTDTTQTITGQKTFSGLVVGSITGSSTSLATTKGVGITGDIIGSTVLYNGLNDAIITATIAPNVNISNPSIIGGSSSNPSITGGSFSNPSITGGTLTGSAVTAVNSTLTTPTITGGTITASSIVSPSFSGTSTGQITSNVIAGVTDGSSAAIGYVGEYNFVSISKTVAVTLVNNTAKDVTSITLQPGDWLVSGLVNYTGLASPATNAFSLQQGINDVSNVIGGENTFTKHTFYPTAITFPNAGYDTSLLVKPIRISISAAKTFYLIAIGNFTNTLKAWGIIEATRVR